MITKENVDYKHIYDFTKEDCEGMRLNGIRLINEDHVTEIYKAIMTGARFICPIEVNINENGIVDGQHRYEAYKRAWNNGYTGTMEVRFLDIKSEEESEVIKDKNTHSKNWTIKDYKRRLALEGNPAMETINNFCMSHSLLHGKVKKDGTAPTKDRYAMAFLRGANITEEIKSGEVKITKEDVKFAELLYSEVGALLERLQFLSTGNWLESFIQAWYDFRRDYVYRRQLDSVGFDAFLDNIVNIERSQPTKKSIWKARFEHTLETIYKN